MYKTSFLFVVSWPFSFVVVHVTTSRARRGGSWVLSALPHFVIVEYSNLVVILPIFVSLIGYSF